MQFDRTAQNSMRQVIRRYPAFNRIKIISKFFSDNAQLRPECHKAIQLAYCRIRSDIALVNTAQGVPAQHKFAHCIWERLLDLQHTF